MTLATQLKPDTGRLSLDLPPSAVEIFEWDSVICAPGKYLRSNKSAQR
jgi:hypothetical protein